MRQAILYIVLLLCACRDEAFEAGRGSIPPKRDPLCAPGHNAFCSSLVWTGGLPNPPQVDLGSRLDLRSPPDLRSLPDLEPPPDLAPVRDLSPSPDLSPCGTAGLPCCGLKRCTDDSYCMVKGDICDMIVETRCIASPQNCGGSGLRCCGPNGQPLSAGFCVREEGRQFNFACRTGMCNWVCQ